MKKRAKSLEWHEECLKNLKVSVERKREELARIQADFDRMAWGCAFYSRQCMVARMRGKAKFDADKFLTSEEDPEET